MSEQSKLSRLREGLSTGPGPVEDPYLSEVNRLLHDAYAAPNPPLAAALEELKAEYLKKTLGVELGQEVAQIPRNSRAADEFYENLLFENLVPAFDSVPMRRAFLFCAYSDEEKKHDAFAESFRSVIAACDCEVIREYEYLSGSQLHRCALRNLKRQTRKQFEASFQNVAIGVQGRLQEEKSINIKFENNFYFGPPAKDAEEHTNWSEISKNVTEALKNLVLVAAGAAFLFDGTLVKSGGSDLHNREISVLKVPREKELEILPKILDATSPQDFCEAIGPLNHRTLPNPGPKTPGSENPTQ
jgi:hypothetical protein